MRAGGREQGRGREGGRERERERGGERERGPEIALQVTRRYHGLASSSIASRVPYCKHFYSFSSSVSFITHGEGVRASSHKELLAALGEAAAIAGRGRPAPARARSRGSPRRDPALLTRPVPGPLPGSTYGGPAHVGNWAGG